jgi:hypothetical protein
MYKEYMVRKTRPQTQTHHNWGLTIGTEWTFKSSRECLLLLRLYWCLLRSFAHVDDASVVENRERREMLIEKQNGGSMFPLQAGPTLARHVNSK